MRYGVISDIHANKEALEEVFKYAKGLHIDEWWMLGDALGYGPDPVAVLELLQTKKNITNWLPGNHDAWIAGLCQRANDDGARASDSRHQEEVNAKYPDLLGKLGCRREWKRWIKEPVSLPYTSMEVWLVHGMLAEYDPYDVTYGYVFPWEIESTKKMLDALRKIREKPNLPAILLHGHTHFPYAFGVRKGDDNQGKLTPIYYGEEQPIKINEFDRLTICPGSVGQPRNPDRKSCAAFGVLDAGADARFEFHLVEYDTTQTRDRMARRNEDLKWINYLFPDNEEHPFRISEPPNTLWESWERCYKRETWGWKPLPEVGEE